MYQLKGKVVNVVLTIQEGKGMESLKNLTLISANFNGRILESDPVNAEDSPIFNTNLIWEIEKKDLRKIRSSNQPLKVECLSIDNQSKREKFGHILLDLRSAQIVEDPGQQVPFRWQKLIGVRNKKRNCIPELYISLTLRNHLEVLPQESCEEIWEPEPRKEGLIPIKYLEDGYIMVGDAEKCTEDYSLNIHIKSASSLDLLLPEVLVFHQNKNKYCMCIKIFGIPIKTKQFSKDLHEKIIFEEKIVVRLLSNITILTQFFNEEEFEVGFNCGNDLLGLTVVSFNQLTNLNEKVLLPACFFRFPSPNGIVPVSTDGRKPLLSLEIYLVKNEKEVTALVDVSKACGDHTEKIKEQTNQELLLITEEQMRELEEWKETQKTEYKEKLEQLKENELKNDRDEIERKKGELNENIAKCKELQEELQEKLDELKLSKTLKKKRKSSSSLLSVIAENQKKFADCDKELLIDYISTLQSDNDNLKQIINEQKQDLENFQKAALTKEQTTNLLQELKGLEEKFEIAQQTKTYFKEQWQKACQEIHDLKTEDYKQLQDQLRERREELDHLCILDEPNEVVSF